MPATNVVVDRGTPGVPQNLQVQAKSPTDVQITWDATNGAAGYWLWRRNVNEQTTFERWGDPVDAGTCIEQYFQFPGELQSLRPATQRSA